MEGVVTVMPITTAEEKAQRRLELRIEQYFQVQDYALWDVIENGNSFKPAAQTTTNADGSSTTLIPGLVTADEKTQKKNDVKARNEEVPTDMALMELFQTLRIIFTPTLDLSYSGLEEFQQPEFEGYGPKTSKSVSENTSNKVRESLDASLVEELVLNNKLEKKIVFPTVAKINFVRPQQQEKTVRKPVIHKKKIKAMLIVDAQVPTTPLESTYADIFGDELELDLRNIATTYPVPTTQNTRIHKDHSLDHVIGNVQSEEPKKVIQALKDPSWIEAMQEELLQFKLQQVWTLVDLPYGKRAIGTKWVYRNKKDERGIMIRNKARLVAQGYTQEEGIDYDEVLHQLPRIKAIIVH
ncbi:putative ribonuclease H-like domain-containing protein [Tanacetum coccineum]